MVGGGSGHYPAFCGVVGPGFADGAVVGNIFTSPSAQRGRIGRARRARRRGRAVDHRQLRRRRDELRSGRPATARRGHRRPLPRSHRRHRQRRARRRRPSGAESPATSPYSVAPARRPRKGADLDDVERVARQANDATRTLGVAFDGCTMPGADRPLFTVRHGTMDLGLGIHGEPGVVQPCHADRRPNSPALLVDGVLAEKPAGASDRVAVILNGLGRTKYEELFVVWKTVAALLDRGRLHRGATRGRRTGHQPRHGRLLADRDVARRRTRTAVDLPRRHPRLPQGPSQRVPYTLRERSHRARRTTRRGHRHVRRGRRTAARHVRSACRQRVVRRSPPRCPTPKRNSAASTPSPATAITAAAWSRAPTAARAAAASAAHAAADRQPC